MTAFKIIYGSAALSSLMLLMASRYNAPSPPPSAAPEPPLATARVVTTVRVAAPISAEQFEQRFAAAQPVEPSPPLAPPPLPLMAAKALSAIRNVSFWLPPVRLSAPPLPVKLIE